MDDSDLREQLRPLLVAGHETTTAYGGGHRRCLGAGLTDFELWITLATILTRVELSLQPRYRHGRIPRSVPHIIATGPHRGIRFAVEGIRHR